MKTIKLTILILLFSTKSFSIVRTISQSGMSFIPTSLTVNVGDVIRWEWSDGNHTTTSKTIPAGAATWNIQLNASHPVFEYNVTMVGTYNYVCAFHESMGMVGSFTAVNATGVAENTLANEIAIYPNPATTILNIPSEINGEVTISDILGKNIKTVRVNDLFLSNSTFQLNVSDLEEGIYFISLTPSDTRKRKSIKFIKD